MSGLFGGNQHTSTTDTKLSSFRMQTATYGLPVQVILGTTRVSGNIIDYIDFTATPHTTTQQTGKGGGSTSSNTSYTYNVAVAIGLGEGEISSVKRVWNDKDITTLSALGLSLIQGNKKWAYMLTKHPKRALFYYKFAYVAGYIDLGNGDSLPNLSFEVAGKYLSTASPTEADCLVTDVFTQILTNIQWGLGLPVGLLGDWSDFNNYCKASGIFFSYAITEAVATNSLLDDMMKTCNSEFVCSEGKLKIVTYCTEDTSLNGHTYVANNPIQFYFDDDSIICDGDSPAVVIERIRYDDTFNSVSLEIMNRAKDYNIDTVEWTDPTDSATRNVISGSSITAHWLTNRDIATMIARLMVWRSLHIRNTYKFTVPYDYYLLDPMDIVAVTDTRLLLNQLPVRIKKITETEKGLEIEAEDVFNGATSPVYSSSGTTEFSPVNNNVLAGNVNPPVVVVVSPTVTQNGSYEAWIAVSGDNSNWGGCSVYTSYDNTSFAKIGTIRNPARHGVLTSTLATSTTDIDTTNTLGVSIYTGQLLSGTVTDRDNLNTLMYVDGELISYQTATLTGTNTYNLTSLKRGAYGSTKAQHDAGTKWARLDGSLFKVTFSSADIGKQMYLKFTSFNVFGGNEQLLSDVVSYPFIATVVGAYVPPSEQIAQASSDLNNQINTVNTQVTNQIDAVNAQVTALNNQLGDISTALSNIIGG